MAVTIKGTNLVYFPVPKIACTSIKMGILAHNDPEKLKLFADGPREKKPRHVHEVYRSFRFRLTSHLAVSFGKKWFTVTRDPVKRAVSGYRNRIVYHKDLQHSAPGALEAMGLPEMPDLSTFALNLAAYTRANRTTFHHFAPITCYLGGRPDRYDRVFKMSELDQLVDYVAAQGVHLTIPREQTGGPKIDADALSDEARAALMDFYREDYEIWGDYF